MNRLCFLVGVFAAAWICACQNYARPGVPDSGGDSTSEGSICPPIACALHCEHGFRKDANGCDICECAGCESDDECLFLPIRSCCPGAPDPCDHGREVGTSEEQQEILRWKQENCDESVECPQYSPPLCSDCYDLLIFAPRCIQGRCVRADTIDCEQLCAAAVKNPDEACPFVSYPDLLTEANLQTCGCTCRAVDPDGFGDCSSCGGCPEALGAGFDGLGCFYIRGCSCEPRCADLFATLDECRSACNRSCNNIQSDILTFYAENSSCSIGMGCVAVDASFQTLYQHCACVVYLNRAANLNAWERLNREWTIVPNGGSERCGTQGPCCDAVPWSPACIDGTCVPDPETDQIPVSDEYLCEATRGVWVEGSCGHYRCGQDPDCDVLYPGCDCGEGRNFVAGVGCQDDPECP